MLAAARLLAGRVLSCGAVTGGISVAGGGVAGGGRVEWTGAPVCVTVQRHLHPRRSSGMMW